MRNEIQIQLDLIESMENVRIVYACESGSRAWGFPSKNSDYDVRYSTVSCMYHYYHMARGNYREYLKGAEVWTKKYFYVLRPLLAIRWIEQSLGVVPTDFNSLVDTIVTEPVLRREIYTLLEAKQGGAELDSGPRIEPISDFIENELARFDGCELERKKASVSTEALDHLFRKSLHEVWHNESKLNFTK